MRGKLLSPLLEFFLVLEILVTHHYSCMLNQVVKLNANKCDFLCIYGKQHVIILHVFLKFYYFASLSKLWRNLGAQTLKIKRKLPGTCIPIQSFGRLNPYPPPLVWGLLHPLLARLAKLTAVVFSEKRFEICWLLYLYKYFLLI